MRSYRGAGVALFQKIDGVEKVLLGLRKNRPFKGTWSFPGGGAHHREELEQAALREFREETGCAIDIGAAKSVRVFDVRLPWFRWRTLAVDADQRIDLRTHSSEFETLKWIPVGEIKGMPLHPWVKRVIRAHARGRLKTLDDACLAAVTPQARE